MPQFDPTYFAAQLFWLVIIFTVLYLVLSRMVLPRIGGVLQERADRIAGDLAKAEQLQNEAERVRASMEQALAEARAKARDDLAAVADQAEHDAAKAIAEAQEKSDQEVAAALARIEIARETAKDDVRAIAVELGQDIVDRFGGKTGDIEKRVDAALAERQGGDAS